MNASDRLAIIRTKTDRANHHLRSLRGEIEKAKASNVNWMMVELGVNDAGRSIFVSNPIVLTDVAIPQIAGDTIHNLRAALDYLVWQLVSLGTTTGETRTSKWTHVQFPIAASMKEYEKAKSVALEGARTSAIQAIDAIKPYKYGNADLWLLHQLDITDKHCSVLSFGKYQLLTGKRAGVMLRTDEVLFQTPDALLDTLQRLVELVSNTVDSFESHLR